MSRLKTVTALLVGLAGVAGPLGFLLLRPGAPAVVAGPEKPARDALGYTTAFEEELKKVGQISPAEFARRYPGQADYRAGLSWDPTTAKFYDQFNRDPMAPGHRGGKRGGAYDFRLDAKELAAFKKNGFVVSERMGAESFAEMFYRIYSRDLPVYISADAVLHAWHRTYDAMLEELEETYLMQSLDEVLAGMADGLPAAARAGRPVLADSFTDADYFLAVARSLLAGQAVGSRLGQDARVAETLRTCDGQRLQRFPLFGRERAVDFSQFKPRGHYEKTERLKRYFRAMMWCGRIDLRVAGDPKESSPRELGAAVVLHDLLRRSGKFEQWRQFDRLVQTFVGRTDSMTFDQLGGLLAAAGIKSPADVKDLSTLEGLQKDILAGKLGLQHVRGDAYVSPFGPKKVQLPRSFTVLGQKFVLDSWALSKVVFDDILWDGKKVQRRVPSGLDVAFAAFGNDQVVPDLVRRMNDANGREFRDGLNYQHNLAAVRDVVDAQVPAAWQESLYMNWLACLRELSKPTTDGKYPEVMRSRAWAMKTLNTQLASWAQLRHDTILYVKQSYTSGEKCYYPAGYVEPVPHFWARLGRTATRGAELIEKTPFPDRTIERTLPRGGKVSVKLREVQKKQAAFLRNFAKQVAILQGIAEKELAQKELSKSEARFLEDVVQVERGSGYTRYNGWYPGLFYGGRTDSGKWDALVADVHTNVPNPLVQDPGCVLHQGVGNVDLLLIAVDNGKDRMMYAGPVLSHYEFEMPGVARKADSEWRNDLRAGRLPARPEWTRGYLVPGVNKEVGRYKDPD